jgi:hypothetical protein
MDSTLASERRWRSLALAATLALLVMLGIASAVAPAARADGDPASDVLADQPVFIPAGTAFSASGEAQLRQVVAEARKAGDPIRVALISTKADLGAITQLWRKPNTYAEFLGEELPDVYHGDLLVVMPNGYGVWIVSRHAPPAARLKKLGASLVGAPLPGTGSATLTDAITGVLKMAASAGYHLAPPTATSLPNAGGSPVPGPIGFAALAGGLILIGGVWTISLRSRPWQRGDGVASPTHGT